MSERLAACHGIDPERDGWPTVSVVVPVRNEGPYLERAVSSILSQEYPNPFDVCLAVAPSDDDTDVVAARLADADDRVQVVANPAGITPVGLNAAIRATDSSIVVRVDGHAELSDGYIRQAVLTMCRTGAVNVGGRQVPKPETPFEEAVAAATTSRLGTGGAAYRVGGTAGPVDTVYLGVFDRAAGDEVGWFDETLIRNQDYEFNIRLRAAGGTIWFDPDLWVGYRPRGTWEGLAKQYYDYGWWKAEVLRRHPGSLRLRQVIPPVAMVGLGASSAVALRRRVAALVPLAYATIVLFVHRRARSPGRAAVATVTVHAAWTAGLAAGLVARRSAG